MKQSAVRQFITEPIEPHFVTISGQKVENTVVIYALKALIRDIQGGHVAGFDIAWKDERLSGTTTYIFEEPARNLIFDAIDDSPTRPK